MKARSVAYAATAQRLGLVKLRFALSHAAKDDVVHRVTEA